MLTTIRNKKLKGRFTVIALIMALIMIIVFSQLYPVIEEFLFDLLAQPNLDPATKTLLALLPFFIAIAIIMSVVWYIVPRRQY